MCTNMTITSKEGSLFFGRTMDLNQKMFHTDEDSVKIMNIPGGAVINSRYHSWTSKYAVLGVGIAGTAVLFDGVNEHGLTGDCQILMEATWENESKILQDGKTALYGEEFVTYILTNFKTVDEIRAHYEMFTLIDEPYVFRKETFQFPLHFCFIDETGVGIVLEPVVNGGFKLYEYIDVMTNSPEYAYHTTNIRHYLGLQNIDAKPRTINHSIALTPIENGTGYGLIGMPGDYTSPSRFIRGFYLKNMIEEFSERDGINALYALFRAFIIPKGLELNSPEDISGDYTQYWSGYDLKNRTLYVQTGEGLTFTAKQMQTNATEITYNDIRFDNLVYTINE
ncbi:linear amide C-N hydrolase [Enterococcus gilvus]|uniref:linear amide C-N hydrolase n=1 Tax=Enterococcus gilvus TaxID=160453 RepID=UPI0028D35F15|nr:linear amide C-N hydrolase [Enterococcus gilvus]